MCLKLTVEDQLELHGKPLFFLNQKTFEGCRGLEINAEIRVSVAAQASVLLLHREPAFYSTLRTILVYPCSHLAKTALTMRKAMCIDWRTVACMQRLIQ
ncbi:zinc-dependent peptidase [bacterium]|nr:zinc-dependent peptidase [bacterium]